MAVLIVKNITREGPALLEGLLKRRGIKFDIVDLDKAEAFPDPLKYDALFVFGGPDSANDTTFKMIEELDLVHKATAQGVPFFGACLGMQVLVKANGGKIRMSDVKEVGWRDPKGQPFSMTFTIDGRKDPLFKGFTKGIAPIFHLHGDTVDLDGNSIRLLAIGEYCMVQAVKVGDNAYGIQGHLELDEKTFKTWIEQDPDLQKLSKQQLEADYEKLRAQYEENGTKLLTNFLKIAGLIPGR